MFKGLKRMVGIGQQSRTTDATLVQRFLRGEDIYTVDSDVRLADAYKQSIAVFRGVNVIGTSLAQIPYVLKDGKRKLQRGPIVDLVAQPNDQMTWFEFILTINCQLCMEGNAFILIDEPNSMDIPRALLPIPPRMLKPRRGKNLYSLLGWEMKSANRNDPVFFGTDQIIHLQYAPDPNDPIIGIGPLQPASITVESDYAASLYNRAMLKSGGLPAGMLRYEGPGRLSEEMKEEVADSWRRTYGGVRSGRRVAVVNKEWKWQQMSASARDMEFSGARVWNLKDIARALNVPMMYLNELESTGLGEAGIALYRRLLYEQNIIPLSKQIETALNNGLWSKISKRLRGGFDMSNVEALREDFNKKVEAGEKLYKIGFSINSINKRLELGMDDEPWGDDWFLPINMVPAIDVLNHSVQLPSRDSNVSDGGTTTKELTKESWAPEENQEMFITNQNVISTLSSRCIGRVRKRMMKIRSFLMEEIAGDDDPQLDRNWFDLSSYFRPFLIESFRLAGGEPSEAESYADERMQYISKYDDGLFSILSSVGSKDDRAVTCRHILNKVMSQIDNICSAEISRAFNFSRISSYRKLGIDRVRLIGACNHASDVSISELGEYPGCGCVISPAKESQ